MKTEKRLNRTYSMRFRFLATVIVAMLVITIFIGGLSIYEVDNYIQKQAKEYVNIICANESSRINDSLSDMEKSVKIMESYLMAFFTSESDVADGNLQKEVIESVDHMFSDVVKHTASSGAISYYFRLDPSVSDGKTGLFYSKLNGGDEFISLEPTDISIYEKDDTEHVGWFWQPYEAGKPIWMKPYYNQNNEILMISYVVPMYLGDTFIGVVGMDFDYMFLANQVHEIAIYENGFAHLEIEGVTACYDEHRHKVDDEEATQKYMRVSKELINGMTLVLSASYDDIRQIRYQIAFEILFVVLVLSSLFIVVAILVVRKIVDPLGKITDAAVKLSNGDYDVEIVHSDTHEIKLLSTAFEDMTTRLREREYLLHLSANRDSLTRLRNTTSYRAWVERFDREKEKTTANYGVVVLDINYLKEANDRYGHDVGNEVIVSAAKIISETFKRSPVFRIGGDEFVAVLENRDLEEREKLFAQFDIECANTYVEKEQTKIPISIARGFAKFEMGTDSNFTDVFKRADDAMYEHKRKMKGN